MRRLLRDVAEGRNLGDTTTLADAGVVEELQRRAAAGGTDDEPVDAAKVADNSPPAGEPENVLDSFKGGADGADNQTVHDAIGARPRLNWSPVTDGGGGAATESAEERSSFHFDLGGALARLGDQPPGSPGDTRPEVESVRHRRPFRHHSPRPHPLI